MVLIGCQASGSGGGVTNDAAEGHVPSSTVFTVSTELNKTYSTGQNIDINLSFPAIITVAGTPILSLTIGSSTVSANYVRGTPRIAIDVGGVTK